MKKQLKIKNLHIQEIKQQQLNSIKGGQIRVCERVCKTSTNPFIGTVYGVFDPEYRDY